MIARATLVLALLAGTAAAAPPAPPAPLPPKPATETLFGTSVTDPYRYFEDARNPAVTAWMKAEGHYTRAVIDAIPGHADILRRLTAFTATTDPIAAVQRFGGRTFYQERAPGSDNADLLVRYPDGTVRKLVDVAAIRAAHGGAPFAINYWHPSWDGAKVAVGISEGGSEDASLFVYDAGTGARVAGPVPLAQGDGVFWTADSVGLFVNLMNRLAPDEPPVNKYKNTKIHFWDLKGPPKPVLGNPVPSVIAFKPDESPEIDVYPGTPLAIAANYNGVQNEKEYWTAPVATATAPGAPWKKLVGRDDGITGYTVVGTRIFFLSHKDAPTFQVLGLRLGQPLSAAKVIVAARADRLIDGIAAAADGLYVSARAGVYSAFFKVPLDGGPEQPLALPARGSIEGIFTDPRAPGALIGFSSWTVWGSTFAYDASGRATDLKLGHGPAGFDAARYAVEDLTAKARDGVGVPLSYVTTKGGGRPRPVLLDAYGSYGISEFPGFATRGNFMLGEGIDYATCHVRGGGELGEAWRLAGKDADKPNTWRDLIACGEALIARGYTTKDQLFIIGGSAGGITMGRAMEERPDLFAGVIDEVPVANPLRQEFSANGPGNTPEFGTIADEQGFRNLLAMDSLHNVSDGTQYPAVMITTGLNDPRVSSWEPAKFAARLRTSGTRKPVFLRVEEQAGHGIGSTKTQNDELYADVISFVKWRSGASGWKPEGWTGN